MKVRQGGEKSLQAPAKKGSLECAATCDLKLGEYGVLDKKKVKSAPLLTTLKVF